MQLRLDFVSFTITGPSTSTLSSAALLNGNIIQTPGNGVAVTDASRCLADQFSVTNPGGTAPPTICGVNTGEHSKLFFLREPRGSGSKPTLSII